MAPKAKQTAEEKAEQRRKRAREAAEAELAAGTRKRAFRERPKQQQRATPGSGEEAPAALAADPLAESKVPELRSVH